MDTLLYWVARAIIGTIQSLPLRVVARLGRALGALVYMLDARHRRVAQRNLERCFGKEKSPEELQALARENFRRIGENFACGAKTAAMTNEELREIIEFDNLEPFKTGDLKSQRWVFAVGHFGNFELYARASLLVPGLQIATTYRGLRQPSLNRLMLSMRNRSGALHFERRTEIQGLKAAMNRGGVALGLFSDQHAGDRGLRLPFFGEDCSTSAAPAVFALRYDCPLYTAICYRTSLARWRVELGERIPTHENGQPRSLEDISLDMNRAFEAAIRRDPANWFWVHNRWKPGKYRPKPSAESITTDD